MPTTRVIDPTTGAKRALTGEERAALRLEVQAARVIDPTLPPYNAPTNGTTDALAALQAALDAADELGWFVVDCRGLTFALSDTLRLRKRKVMFTRFKLRPHSTYSPQPVDYTNMGAGVGTVTGTMIANRGRPLLSATYRDTPYQVGQFGECRVVDFEIDGEGRAPGFMFEGFNESLVDGYNITQCVGYHMAALVRNGNTWIGWGQIQEDFFGGPKQLDPVTNPYISAGYVQTCPDVTVDAMSPRYCKHPIWADGFSNCQWNNLHPFNGNGVAAALPNIYVGPDCRGIQCSNMYLDKGHVELRSFNHSFVGGRLAYSSADSGSNFYALLVANGSTTVDGLIIDGITGGNTNLRAVVLDQTAGQFTSVRNTKISALATEEDNGSANNSYITNKWLTRTVDPADWVQVTTDFWRYDTNLEPDLVFVNVPTNATVHIRDRRTGASNDTFGWYYRLEPNAGPGTKVLSLYCDRNPAIALSIRVSEGALSESIS